MRIAEIQQALREEGLDAWLFFDHHHRDPLAYRVLKFEPTQMVTRRWYYLVPAQGEPVGLVHKIESGVLGNLPGSRRTYAGWVQQREALTTLLDGYKTVAMQYSPNCAVPYVSNIDAGTMELVRATGVNVVTSANLIQTFEAQCTQEQYESHMAAGVKVDAIRRAAFAKVSQALSSGTRVTEIEIQQFLLDSFKAEGLFTDHGPIVGVNAHAGDPHYAPTPENSVEIKPGDLLLIDLWAKFDRPGSIYYDITWTGFCGPVPTDEMLNVFAAVTGARDAAIACVKDTVAAGKTLYGYQVDDACRNHLIEKGLAEHFFHRTGHSIGEEVHGNGANMDNYETHDERLVIPGACFSVEPGVYLSNFGIRSEINMFRHETSAEVTGEIQRELLRLL
ncbi:M24 family metallopeptidase [uncultured Paludibaculum sp.]|uniref:M24 family metallopeptidase n=1 Tax=uncultured Paludibaculum sp. TaxID=1765020 RepID=UPI002AAB6AC1|nr:M24 family metallopeptidase [uncultured Paludibaculum sp.]